MKKIFLLLCFCVAASYSYGQSYCTPSFGGAYYSCAYYGLHVGYAKMIGTSGTIADSAACDGSGYLDRTALSCAMNMAGSYTMTVTNGTYYAMSGQVWIDVDNDGTFASSESVGGFAPATGTSVFTITLPTGSCAASGRMRLLICDAHYGGASYPSISPCGGYYYGEARDYLVHLSTAPTGTLSPSSMAFSGVTAGTTSATQVTVFNGAYLSPASGNLTVTASTNFLVCSSSAGTYVSSYSFSYTGAAVSANNIYVKFVAPSTPGTYTGTVCVSGGGLSSAVCMGIGAISASTLETEELPQESRLAIYPNPASTRLTVAATEPMNHIEVTNLLGVTSNLSCPGLPAKEYTLDISDLPAGMYFIKVNGGLPGHFLKR